MRTKRIEALERLACVAGAIRNPYIDKAKADGRRIVGVFYQETPEEILTAAGCVPVQLRGTGAGGVEYAEAYFRQLTCNFTRCTFNRIIDGAWDFLDGAVIPNNCDHLRRIYDNWKKLPENKAYCFLYVPKKRGDLAKSFYKDQVARMIEATEARFGVKVTPGALREAVALHNETRRLQRKIYEMQLGDEVPLTGSELVMTMFAGVCMPREDYNALLRELIGELAESGETSRPAVRLLYTGGHVDNKEFFDLFGAKDADIVVDNLGFGTRACDRLVDQAAEDPLEAITDYYFDQKPAATRQFGTTEERLSRIADLAAKYRVDGVVMTRVSMCDIWAFEQFMARDHLRRLGMPLLELEVDYLPEGQGQIATRLQAFVERIKALKQN